MAGNYGNLVVVDHGFGIVTKYGHLSRFGVMDGQQINRGDVLGYVGSTGRSTSPHLHYEIWVNDQLDQPDAIARATSTSGSAPGHCSASGFSRTMLPPLQPSPDQRSLHLTGTPRSVPYNRLIS